jgi:lysophospholipase L1-like esterase
VIIMLGTNDLKTHFNSSAEEIAANVGLLCDGVLQSEYLAEHRPQLLVCAPTSANEASPKLPEWFAGASGTARDLPELIEREALNRGVLFLNVAGLLDHDFQDSLHWNSVQHLTVSKAIAAVIAG